MIKYVNNEYIFFEFIRNYFFLKKCFIIYYKTCEMNCPLYEVGHVRVFVRVIIFTLFHNYPTIVSPGSSDTASYEELKLKLWLY